MIFGEPRNILAHFGRARLDTIPQLSQAVLADELASQSAMVFDIAAIDRGWIIPPSPSEPKAQIDWALEALTVDPVAARKQHRLLPDLSNDYKREANSFVDRCDFFQHLLESGMLDETATGLPIIALCDINQVVCSLEGWDENVDLLDGPSPNEPEILEMVYRMSALIIPIAARRGCDFDSPLPERAARELARTTALFVTASCIRARRWVRQITQDAARYEREGRREIEKLIAGGYDNALCRI